MKYDPNLTPSESGVVGDANEAIEASSAGLTLLERLWRHFRRRAFTEEYVAIAQDTARADIQLKHSQAELVGVEIRERELALDSGAEALAKRQGKRLLEEESGRSQIRINEELATAGSKERVAAAAKVLASAERVMSLNRERDANTEMLRESARRYGLVTNIFAANLARSLGSLTPAEILEAVSLDADQLLQIESQLLRLVSATETFRSADEGHDPESEEVRWHA